MLEAIQTAYQGKAVSQVYEGNRIINVAVILDPTARSDPGEIGSLLLQNGNGLQVKLDALADVFLTNGRSTVAHDGASRLQTVTCNVRGRDLTSFVSEAERTVSRKVSFPAGVYAIFGGSSEARATAQREILLYSVIAIVGIILLLFMVFGNLRNLGLTLVNLPFALVGGVLAAFLTGGYLTVGSLVGFITLFGITTRNSIMMISHFEHLVNKEGMFWGREAAFRGAAERLVPILHASEILKKLCFCLFGLGCIACTPAPWRRREVGSAMPRGIPTLGTKWKGRSAAEVCTSEARKIGETACARERAAPS